MTNKTFTTEQDFNKEVISFLRQKFYELRNKDFEVRGSYESDASDNYIIRDFTFLKKTENGIYMLVQMR